MNSARTNHATGTTPSGPCHARGCRRPRHVAIIMDGNGRWAARHGLPRIRGHEVGAESVRCVIRCCREHGIPFLTLYAFSVENWGRPRTEVAGLMRLLRSFLRAEEHEMHAHRIRLRLIGRRADVPRDIRRSLERVERATAGYDAGTLILALSYGARQELTDAVRRIADAVRRGALEPEAINEDTLQAHLYAPDIPDPDLLIRTSGEMRLSNFLLWQLSYTELYVTPVLWPDFRETAFADALDDYARRERRFGRRDTVCPGTRTRPKVVPPIAPPEAREHRTC